jgi:hypothetical protein
MDDDDARLATVDHLDLVLPVLALLHHQESWHLLRAPTR